jgi:hypothetical protein
VRASLCKLFSIDSHDQRHRRNLSSEYNVVQNGRLSTSKCALSFPARRRATGHQGATVDLEWILQLLTFNVSVVNMRSLVCELKHGHCATGVKANTPDVAQPPQQATAGLFSRAP